MEGHSSLRNKFHGSGAVLRYLAHGYHRLGAQSGTMLSDLTVYIVRWEPRLGYTISGVLMLWFRPRQPFQEKTRQSREDPFLTS